jgi:diguanylate cyclase (GGDEF)-like protein/PAS domain S-box-containing protein
MMGSYLKNLALYKQLTLPMLLVGLLAIAAGVYAAMNLEDSIAALNHMDREGGRRLSALEDIDNSLTLYRALMLRHLASERASSMSAIESELDETGMIIDLTMKFMMADHPSSDRDVDVLSEALDGLMQVYFEETNNIVALSADFEKERAFVALTEKEATTQPKIDSLIKALRRHESTDISQSRDDLVTAVRRNLLLTMIIGMLGGISVLAIAFVVTRRITQRLSSLLEWSNEISKGHWSRSLTEGSGDEVGQLTRAMENMRRNIQSAHDELAESKLDAERAADTLKIYANAFENSGEPILISDKRNKIININRAFSRLTGYSCDELTGKDPRVLSSGKTPVATYQEMWRALNEVGFWHGELWDRTKDGRVFPKLASISAIKNEYNENLFYVASFTDISDQKAAEERIARLAHHDILTGLQNRFSLESRLEQALSIARRDNTLVAILFIDLDRFKDVNDSLGHHAGDKLLMEVASRLKSSVRDSDVVARIGGDEFVIVLTGMKDSTQAGMVAETVLRQVCTPCEIERHTVRTSPSIGISIYPDDGSSVDELMRNADIAMYHAKELGRNNYHFFTESMLVTAQERLKVLTELRSALEKGQLQLYYQPQIDPVEQCVSSMEALVRWDHAERGMIPPTEFISIAEENGLIHELGQWIMDEACRQLAAWRRQGITGLRMAVNLSAKQLHSGELSTIVSEVLARHRLQGADLELEITETAAMADPEIAIRQLDALRELGVGLAIDDFGTGYSSLGYLKRLPIQTLKLDRTFVRDIETDENDLEISRATIGLAHNLDLKVVAEGVETKGQIEFLIEHSCDLLQGYYFSKPLPAGEATAYLLDENSCAFKGDLGRAAGDWL